MRRAEGASVNVSELRMSAHTGTHADGPLHVADGALPIGLVPLEPYLGPARVYDVRQHPRIDDAVAELVLRMPSPQRALPHRLLDVGGRFPEVFPAITPSAARRLVDAGVRLVGTDAPSVDPFDSKRLETHHILGAEGCAILENLLLRDVPEGEYELIALPLRLEEADASPVRAVLRPR
jgi:arylformamidase